jgi:hypothetical protein
LSQSAKVQARQSSLNDIQEFKNYMKKLESTFSQGREIVKKLKQHATEERQKRSYEKANGRLQTEIDEYFRAKPNYEIQAIEKNAVAPNKLPVAGSFASTGSFATNGDDVPVMKVYDQTDFINKREGEIKELHQKAHQINDLAYKINDNIYQQGDKLDGLNKQMENQVTDLKKGNDELVKAREITAQRNKNVCCWVIFIFVLFLIVGAFIYFTFFDNK